MKKKKVIIICICCFTCLVFFCVVGGYLYNKNLVIKLNGKANVNVDVLNKYKDEGAKGSVFNNDLTNSIKSINKVNTKKVGKYKIVYTLNSLFFTKSIERYVNVIDKEVPKIELVGDSKISITVGDEFREPGYKAIDNYDKDITSKVKVEGNVDSTKVGNYSLIYSVADSSGNNCLVKREVEVKEKVVVPTVKVSNSSDITYIRGIMIVNKKYSIPSTYNYGVDPTANSYLKQLQGAASSAGFSIPMISGFRSYNTQVVLYNRYVARDGQAAADTYSARPGHSEHQTGLAFDVGQISDSYGSTSAGVWLRENCSKYGFIIRYPKGKESITGYCYEPWHIRYVGVGPATEIMNRGITLEEYLGV